ncbi:hypothetical protein DW929_07485 [Eubacterium ventriosum]|uniref:Uncharacterized protein n=1 Tax=Eubacterium ventriosum TaxID=39496 RepID=A0A413S022_9FIRM|nr:hypothetical protein [Eubacterium ventriosum]RHA54515.1 hypothetical protein DW929_07485 [Eubacterium ventriosum]
MNINIEIKGQQAHIVNQQSLISGTSNLEEIKFDFSSEWNGYTKTAVIYVDDYSISDSVKMLVEKDVVSAEKLPDWLFREECELYIGVFGDNSEGRRITSTIVCQKVKKGVPVDVVNEITPDIYNQIIKIMCDAKALVKEADEKIEVNKGYLEQAEQKANDAADYADRAGNYLEEVVGQKTDVEKLIANIDVKVEESTTNIANITEAKMNDISSLTEAKSNDIATLTTAKLGDINNTAQAQIESINTVAQQNIKSGTDAVNETAQGKIYSINETARGQINGINETAQGKIKDINNTATSQISAINNTATNQIKAINKTAQSQIKNMTIKYSDMCRTLGIEHEGIMLAKTSYNGNESGSIPPDIYSIDVSKFRYIEFGKIVVTYPNGDYEYTLPSDNISIYLTNLKDDPALKDVTTGKRYDVSLLNDLQFYVSYIGSGGYETTVNYKLYNKLEETTEE